MPAKRRATETDTPRISPNNIAPGLPKPPAPGAQPAPVKRQRVSRACDQCRAAREKCDGVQPQCFPCVSQSRSCTYDVSPRKRGVQTGYIRTLELALGWVFERVPGSEETLNGLLAHEGSQGQAIFGGKDPSGADRLHKRWRKSRVHKGIDHILSGGTLPSPGDPSADASEAEGDVARRRSRSHSADAGLLVDTHDTLNSLPASVRYRLPTPRPHGTLEIERQREPSRMHLPQPSLPPPSLNLLKLPANHWRLLDIYFSYTHSWLPILEKQDIFQTSYLYPEEGLVIDPQVASSAVHAELWAALALASLQNAASSRLGASDGGDDAAGLSPAEIYGIARRIIPPEDGAFQIQHARALLLLSLVNLGQDKLTGAWILVGFATRILLDAGMATPCGQDQRTSLTLMACFMVDTILSIRCNKPPNLRAEDLTELSPIPEDGLDQWEPWAPCDGFGVCGSGSRASRNPAFCMSTFNQLYTIVRAVAMDMLVRRRGSSPSARREALATQLQQVIRRDSPLGSFTMSPNCGTASVPTVYLVRAAYLWANALADPRSDGVLHQLNETLDQYQRIFGKCGMPAFISACLASLASPEHLLNCSDQQKERAKHLVSAYSPSIGTRSQPTGTPSSHPRPLPQPAQQQPHITRAPILSPPDNVATTCPAPNIPPLYNSPPSTHNFPFHSRGYGSFEAPTIPTQYQRPFTDAAAALPQRNSQMSMHAMASMPAITVNQTQTQTHHHNSTHLPPPPLPPTGFGATPDYEALLDDLASIECTDPVDVDPQFMTNLGFAPGCDITEIFTRDFGSA